VDEVCSIIRDTNTASQRVVVRNGMVLKDSWTKALPGAAMLHYRYAAVRKLLKLTASGLSDRRTGI